jgi:4'-phosphopantetheinyl transferase
MPVWKKWTSEGAVWGIWRVSESQDKLRNFLKEALPYDAELAALKSPTRRMEYLAVRVLLKALTGQELQIAHYVSGQPYLVNDCRRISISHTKGYVAVGIHDHALPGIDIEQVSERVLKIVSRFIRPDEFVGKEQLDSQWQLYGALLHWSAKETLFKLLETSEVDFLAHLRVSPFLPQVCGRMAVREYRTVDKQSFTLSYFVSSDFVCVWGIKA